MHSARPAWPAVCLALVLCLLARAVPLPDGRYADAVARPYHVTINAQDLARGPPGANAVMEPLGPIVPEIPEPEPSPGEVVVDLLPPTPLVVPMKDKPAETSKPGGGAQPSDGGKPGDGGKPSDGGKPRDGGNPKNGGKPGTGGKPKDGGKPNEGGKPSDGAKPGIGGKPNEGGTPGDGGKPTNGPKPGEGGKPDPARQPKPSSTPLVSVVPVATESPTASPSPTKVSPTLTPTPSTVWPATPSPSALPSLVPPPIDAAVPVAAPVPAAGMNIVEFPITLRGAGRSTISKALDGCIRRLAAKRTDTTPSEWSLVGSRATPAGLEARYAVSFPVSASERANEFRRYATSALAADISRNCNIQDVAIVGAGSVIAAVGPDLDTPAPRRGGRVALAASLGAVALVAVAAGVLGLLYAGCHRSESETDEESPPDAEPRPGLRFSRSRETPIQEAALSDEGDTVTTLTVTNYGGSTGTGTNTSAFEDSGSASAFGEQMSREFDLSSTGSPMPAGGWESSPRGSVPDDTMGSPQVGGADEAELAEGESAFDDSSDYDSPLSSGSSSFALSSFGQPPSDTVQAAPAEVHHAPPQPPVPPADAANDYVVGVGPTGPDH